VCESIGLKKCTDIKNVEQIIEKSNGIRKEAIHAYLKREKEHKLKI